MFFGFISLPGACKSRVGLLVLLWSVCVLSIPDSAYLAVYGILSLPDMIRVGLLFRPESWLFLSGVVSLLNSTMTEECLLTIWCVSKCSETVMILQKSISSVSWNRNSRALWIQCLMDGEFLFSLETLRSLYPIFVWPTDALVALAMCYRQIWSFPTTATVSMRMNVWKANLSVGLRFRPLFQRLESTCVVTIYYLQKFTLQGTVP
jgi:hypothetical protein